MPHSDGLSRAELDAAVSELRTFVAELMRDGLVAPDGSVTDPPLSTRTCRPPHVDPHTSAGTEATRP
ncbi:hypothetical protein ACQEV2_33670 [Streptomyces sp. CA-251387]|uniref:hypothetical protein n=1 Tax=Streptomyces sp. CA-251387 TaxID=3240064 RepID=UPI003D8C89E5